MDTTSSIIALQKIIEDAHQRLETPDNLNLLFSEVNDAVNVMISRNMQKLLDLHSSNKKTQTTDFLNWLKTEKQLELSSSVFYAYLRVGKNGEGRSIPTGLLLAFCEYVEKPIQVLFADPDVDSNHMHKTPLHNFLQDIFWKNKRYVYNTKQDEKFKALLNREYYCYWLPLTSGHKKLSIATEGIIKFFESTDGLCYVKFDIVKGHSISVNTKWYYEGFALLLEPNTNRGTCWCFLKNTQDDEAELCVLSFRYRVDDVENITNLESRVAEVITLTANKARPTLNRMLFSTRKVKENERKYIAPLLKFSNSKIILTEENYFTLSESLSTELKEAFLNLKKTSVGSVYSIELSDIEKLGNGQLIALARKMDFVSPHYNKASLKADDALRQVLNWLDDFKEE